MRRNPNRIDEERVCIDSLVQHLRGIDGGSSVEAQEEPDDPPDYWLTIGGHRFAVEVTSIVTDQGYDALCRALCDSVEVQNESDFPFVGTYAFNVLRRPDIPKRGSKEWKKLIADAKAGIENLAGSPPDSKVRLSQDANGRIDIFKLDDNGAAVRLCRASEAKWEGEIQGELSQLLRQSIEKKREKIQSKGVLNVCANVILVLYDAFGYGDVENAKRALSNLGGYDWLHSIFWAASFSDRANVLYPSSPGRAGAFLYSKNDGWR